MVELVSGRLDPLVGDPLLTEKDRTSGVQRLDGRHRRCVVIVPEDGGVAYRFDGDAEARERRGSSEFDVGQVDHEGRHSRCDTTIKT